LSVFPSSTFRRKLTLLVSSFTSKGAALAALAQTEKTKQPPAQQSQQKEKTVYITRTGQKYHGAGCSYLRSSSIPIRLSDAKARGYTAWATSLTREYPGDRRERP
jgi:hypothetical protein